MRRKKKIYIWNWKNCLEATQLKNKMNHLGKNKIEEDNLSKSLKELIKNNKLMSNHNKDLKVKDCFTFKSVRLLYV